MKVDGSRPHIARWQDQSGQAMVEYILVVVLAVVSLILVSEALTRSVLAYFQMQAVWISLPIL